MRRLIVVALLLVALSNGAGCILPIYSADPQQRTEELIYTSENLRMFLEEWRRVWFLEMPDHMTPFRTHGGII